MKVRMMFVAIVAVMIAVGLLAIINMQKNPGGEREMTMNDEKLQLSKECSRLLDASIKSNVPIVLDMGEDFCPTLYVTEGERGTFYNLAGFDSIEELRAKSKEALANNAKFCSSWKQPIGAMPTQRWLRLHAMSIRKRRMTG